MRRIRSTLVALLTSVSVSGVAAPASAVTYQVCLVGEEDALQCDYDSLEQCQAAASGGQGDCIMNPAFISDTHARYHGADKGIR
jgi:hypothetical protein